MTCGFVGCAGDFVNAVCITRVHYGQFWSVLPCTTELPEWPRTQWWSAVFSLRPMRHEIPLYATQLSLPNLRSTAPSATPSLTPRPLTLVSHDVRYTSCSPNGVQAVASSPLFFPPSPAEGVQANGSPTRWKPSFASCSKRDI